MSIYYDPICAALGLIPIKELIQDYEEDNSIPEDASNNNRFGELNSFYGKTHTEEVKAKIAENSKRVHTGRKRSQETKSKMSKSQMGKRHSSETKLKLSVMNLGRSVSLETREKLSKVGKGVSKEETHKEKIRDSNKGKLWKCDHCAIEGGHGMFRWHFDNCKQKPKD